MMNKKGHLDTKKIVIILAAVIGLIFIAAAVYFGLIVNDRAKATPEPTEKPVMVEQGGQEKPQETQGLDAVQVDLVEYTTYRLEDLDFQFVIAKVRVKAEEPINISLNHFKTSEGLALDETDSYVKKLEDNLMFLGKQNVCHELISSESSYVANIFIPVKDKMTMTVNVELDFGENKPMNFDLKKATGTREMLGYVAEDVITDGKTYQMQVTSAYPITGDTIVRTLSNGNQEEVMYPSTAEIYAFNLEAVSLWGDEVTIERAVYVTESGLEFEALSSQHASMKIKNIVDRTVREKDSGALFFVTLNSSGEPITYKGTLKLKLKGQENWIVIHVDL